MNETNNICLSSGGPKYLKDSSMGSYYTKASISLGIKFEMKKVKGVLPCTTSYILSQFLLFVLLVIEVPAYRDSCFHPILLYWFAIYVLTHLFGYVSWHNYLRT